MRSKKVIEYLLVSIALVGIFATLHISRAAGPKAATLPQQELSRFLRRHESLQLDAKAVARAVRETGQLSLTTPTRQFDLQLVPHDMRAPNYSAEEVGDGGSIRQLPLGSVNTWRGTAGNLENSEARFTIDDEKIEGVIITPGELYYVEPLSNFSKGAPSGEYVAYTSADVIEGAHGVCATLDDKLKSEYSRLNPTAPQSLQATSNRQIEFATEADFEYVSYFGSSAAANAEILSIMNQIDGLYRQKLGITFSVNYQHTWATSDDPYSASAADQMLYEFTNYWNASMSSHPRDEAHLWTNRPMEGNVVGIAWLGTVCQGVSHAYGASERVSDGLKYAISAHEIGHNLGASHPDDQSQPDGSCSDTIMNSYVGNTFDFCQFSQNELNAYINSHSSCLTVVASPASIQFSAANYSVNEAAASATITVTRGDDTSSAVSVDYKTSNGTASARTDYMTAIKTMSFAAGETSKTFRVFIVDDFYIEGSETINLTLTNPSVGAVLGSQTTATVAISDNDTAVPTANPLDTPNFFVRQHYLDFLNREADSAGLTYWTGTLTPCGTDRACLTSAHTTVSAAFFIEGEFQETGYYVYRLYKAGLGRSPAFPEFVGDRGRVVANSNLEASKLALAADFVTRSAFLTLHPAGLTSAQYVDQLNASSGNSLTAAERNSLVSGLNSGSEDRATVLKKIAENQVFRQREYNAAFVMMQYFGYLRRNPDQSGYDFWLAVLNNQPSNFRGMVCSFLTSAEYQLRFSPVVTTSNMDCGQ
jgi:hypothetical protein